MIDIVARGTEHPGLLAVVGHAVAAARHKTGYRFHGLTVATPHASKSAVLRVTTLAFRQ
jgi:hypothetical protein